MKSGDFLKESRLNQIRKIINAGKEVRIEELLEKFPDISSMTIRRDLAELEELGEIIRIRGGARSISSLTNNSIFKEETYTHRIVEHEGTKKSIAEKAVKYIEKGRSVYMDAGTTIMALASVFPENFPLAVLTSAPNIAVELIKKQGIAITLVGGQLSRENIAVSGSNSIEFVKNINIDIAFIGASGFSLESGFTTGDYNEGELKKCIVKKARRVIVLMDSSKLDQNMLFTFATLKDVDVLISDIGLPENIIKMCSRMNVAVE